MDTTAKNTMLLHELFSHLPYSIFFTAAGMAVAGLLLYVAIVCSPPPVTSHGHEQHREEAKVAISETGGESREETHHQHHPTIPSNPHVDAASFMIFHLFHPIHLLLSAIATTAMFWRPERRLFKATSSASLALPV